MSATILIVDDEQNFRQNTETYLSEKGYETSGVATLTEAREQIDQGAADIVLLDVSLPDGYGPSLLEDTMHIPGRPPIILITAFGDIDMAVAAMKNGAQDFLQKPVDFDRLEQSIQRASEIVTLRREVNHYREAQQKEMENFCIGNTPAMKEVVSMAERAARAEVHVLLTGLTGTGKELVARYIHRMSPRAEKRFLAINCATIQPNMLESELFGHEAGAFTSAEKRKHGLMELADKGILFLDEISSMPVDMQAKLLRAIQEQNFLRMGGTTEIKVDVMFIAASNRDLPTLIKEQNFREDLYYRLKIIDIHLPPLVERKEDIPEMVGMFIREINPLRGLNVEDISPRAMKALMAHDWPGNNRELHNAIERAMIFCDGPTIDIEHLPGDLI